MRDDSALLLGARVCCAYQRKFFTLCVGPPQPELWFFVLPGWSAPGPRTRLTVRLRVKGKTGRLSANLISLPLINRSGTENPVLAASIEFSSTHRR
jgi:hypothetical protein